RLAYEIRAPARGEAARTILQQLGELGAGCEQRGVELELGGALREPGAQYRDGRCERPIDAVGFGQAQLRRRQLDARRDRVEQVLRDVVAQPAVDPADAHEIVAATRRTLHDPRQGEVGEHVPSGYVEGLGRAFAPRGDLLGNAAPGAAQLARPLDPPPRGLGVRPRPNVQPALFALV